MTLPVIPSRFRLPALAVGAVLLVAGLYALTGDDAPTTSAPVAAAPDTTVSPTADNVDPAVHGRLMALRARAEAAPDSAAPHLALGRFLQSGHRPAEAAEAFEAALAREPLDRQTWLDLTTADGAASDWPAAARAADRMAERFESDGAALYNAGAAYANAGDADAARRRFESATRASDAAMAAQARDALARLNAMPEDALAAASSAPPSAGAAPPLAPGAEAGPLPAGHPPLPATPTTGGTATGTTATRVVTGGTADPEAVRAALARHAPLSARP